MSVKHAKVTSATANARDRWSDIRAFPTKARRLEGTRSHHHVRRRRIFFFCRGRRLSALEQQAAERRDDEAQRLVEAVRGDRFGRHAAAVADVAAAVDCGVAVQQLGIPAGLGYADTVLRTWNRREVE